MQSYFGAMSLLNVSGISKKQGEEYVVKNVNFVQEASQKIAIAGATGSGKSTLLKIIAGLIQPDSGEVLFEGKRVRGPLEKLLPGHPQIAYLSQHFELRNNYRVEEILQMASKVSDTDAKLIYEVCRIAPLLKRRTNELSGGERQRISFSKALITSPKLLLLDEPFSNLDAIHRGILKTIINDIEQRLNVSCLLVSHDPVDLLSWADEIIILNEGKIIQRGPAEEVYRRPVNEYAAALFGKYNLITTELLQLFPSLANSDRRFIRPADFRIIVDEANGVKAEIISINFMGGFYEIELNAFGQMLTATTNYNFEKGEIVTVHLNS